MMRPSLRRAHRVLLTAAAALAIGGVAIAPGYADSGTIGVDDVVLDLGLGKYHIKHMDVTDANLGAAEIKALFAGAGAGSMAGQIMKLSAKSIVIPEMDFEQTFAGIEQKLVYRDSKLTGLANGKLASFDIASGALTSKLPDGKDMSAELRGLHGADIDFAALARMMTEPAKAAGAPLLPLYGESSIESYLIKLPNLEISVGPISAKGIKGRPLKVPFTELFAKFPKTPKTGAKPSPEEMKILGEFMASMFDVYGAVSVASTDIGPIRISFAGDPATGVEPFGVTLKHASLKDYADSRIGEFSAEGLDIKAAKATIHMGAYRLYDYDFKAALANLATIMKSLPTLEDKTQPPPPEFLKAVLEVYTSISLGKFELSDLTFDVEDSATGKPVSVALGRFAISDFKNAHIGEIALDGIDVKTADGKVHLGKSALRGFDFKDLLASFGDLMGKFSTNPDGDGAPQLSPANLKMPKLEEFRIEDASVDAMTPASEETPEAGPTPVKASLGVFSLKPDLGPQGVPRQLTLVLDHLKVALPPNDPNVAIARAAGVEDVDLSSKIEAGWDDVAQQLKIGGLSVSGEGLGKVSVSGVIGNVPKEAFFGDEFVRQAALLGAVLKSAEIRIENTSLMQKIITAEAKTSGQSEGEMKSMLIAGAAVGIPAMLGNSPASKALANAVAKFLADPKTLHITASSKDGVGAGGGAG